MYVLMYMYIAHSRTPVCRSGASLHRLRYDYKYIESFIFIYLYVCLYMYIGMYIFIFLYAVRSSR